MPAPIDLLVVGNICVDIYIPPHATPPPGGIETIPAPGIEVGGNGANVAVTAARLGVRTAVAGVLGDDLFGRHLLATLASEGVDVSRLKLIPERTSPLTLVLNDARGERSFVHHPGTNADFTLPADALELPPRVVHLAAPELLAGLWPDGAVAAAKRVKEAGSTLTLDVFAIEGPDRDRLVLEHLPLFRLADMVFPNEDEARLVTGRSDLDSITAYFHNLGVRVAAVKRGQAGAIVSWNGSFTHVPAEKVGVVDTCGAGDSFVGGFLAGVLGGLDPLESARLGCALGTLCVEHQGALSGTRERGRLEAILARFDMSGRESITL